MKKVLSLVLVIAMVLSSMSFAFASTFEDVTGDYEDAINTLTGLGVVTGYEDGTYRPDKVVTRAEMAKLMVQILGYGDLVAGAKSNFTDTQGHWADAYIALAAGRNIVVGDGNGKFRPDATVTYNEVLTMIVRGLGYTDDSNELKNMTWPTNFKVKAAELGITDGVKMSTTGADRGGVAQALYNALDSTLVTVDTDGNVTSLKDTNNVYVELLSRIAQKAGTYSSAEKRYEFKVQPKHVDSSNKDYAGDIVDLTPYMYQTIEAYASKNDEDLIVYVGDVYSDTVEGTFVVDADTVVADNEVQVKLADGTVEDIDIDKTASIPVFYNGSATTLTEAEMEDNVDDGNVVGLDDAKVTVVLNEDDEVEAIVAQNATSAARITRTYKADATKIGKINLPLKGEKVDLSKVTVTGAVDDIKDIEIDDIVVAYAAKGYDNDNANIGTVKVELVVVRDTVEGKVTKVNKESTTASTTIYIDGVKYTKSATDGQTDTFDVGNEGTFFLDDSGKVFAKEATTLNDAKDYGVIIQVYPGAYTGTPARKLADPELKIITASGEVVTYEVSEDAYYQGGTNTSTSEVFEDDSTKIASTDLVKYLEFNADKDGKALAPSALIKYKLDSDGMISRIQIVKLNAGATTSSTPTMDTTKASFDVADKAPIFNIKSNGSTNKNDYSVVSADDVPSIINVTYSDVDDDGAYKVIVSTNADTSTGTFALITGVNFILNDDDVKVAEVTAYVDGKEVVYEAKAGVTVTSAAIDTNGAISKLELENGKIKTSVTAVETASKTTPVANSFVSKVSSSRVLIKTATTDGSWIEYNVDDAVAYVIDNNGEFKAVESIEDLAGYDVVAYYDTNASEAGFEIIIVK